MSVLSNAWDWFPPPRYHVWDRNVFPHPRYYQLSIEVMKGNCQMVDMFLMSEPELKQFLDMNVRHCPLLFNTVFGSGDVDMLHLLLSNGADVDVVNDDYQTPLHVTILTQRYKTAEVLLLANANPDGHRLNREYSPLNFAAYHGDDKAVMLLLKYGADTLVVHASHGAYKHDSPLNSAVLKHSTSKCFELLLAAGAEPDERKWRFSCKEVEVEQEPLIHLIALKCSSPVPSNTAHLKHMTTLFVLCGGYLWQRNAKKELVTDLAIPDDDRMVIKELMGKPLTLYQLCRISVRREIKGKRFHLMKTLPLPTTVIDYLLCKDIIEEECLIHV